MSKKNKNHIAYSGYTSSSSDDDVCIIDEITSKSNRECHSITPITISDSSLSQADYRCKRKNSELSTENENINNEFIIDRRRNPERPVIDRNGVSLFSFAHEFNRCEAVEKIEKKMRMSAEKYSRTNRHEGESSRMTCNYPGYPPVPAGITRLNVRDESFVQSEIENDFPPCPGLEHITEIRGLEETSYFCGICENVYTYDRILDHLKHTKHQVNTLKALAPDLYHRLKREPKSKRRKILLAMLSDIKKGDGNGRIIVEKEYLDEDRHKEIGYLQSTDTPGTSCNNHGLPFYEPTYHCVPLNADSTNQILLDKSKMDYFCLKCECNMLDEKMYKSHTKRNPSLKGIRKYPVATKTIIATPMPKSEAFLIDRVTGHNEPYVGLDYVREFQHAEDKKETYHCFVCGECLSCIEITQHVASLSHRLMYLEYINHSSIDFVRGLHPRQEKTFYIIEEICRKIQRECGTGYPEVFIIKNQNEDD